MTKDNFQIRYKLDDRNHIENLWDKYAVSSRELEGERTQTLKILDEFLVGLGYLRGKA